MPGVESLSLDLSEYANCVRACEGAVEVYNLAADMGGMGFIERNRVECLRTILINTHMVEAAYRAGARRFFFSSSACAYNITIQQDPNVRALKESDAYPAMAERGYGWEKLMSEIFCQEYWEERGLETHIARFHNVYGPHGTWDGGREKAPAAICRKVIAAKDSGSTEIPIWGDGTQTRSFMFIEDCVKGIDMIMHCKELIATPINLGSSELISVDHLVSLAEEIGGVKLTRKYQLDAPRASPAATATTPSSSRCWAGSRARRSATVWPRPTPGSSSSTWIARRASTRWSDDVGCWHVRTLERANVPIPSGGTT